MTLFFGWNLRVDLLYLIAMLLYQQHNNVVTLQLQCRFSNNITILCRRLLIDVFFATLLQPRDMVEKQLITASSQRRCVYRGES